jgi:hypothetical protein
MKKKKFKAGRQGSTRTLISITEILGEKTMGSFWIKFIISEALSVLEAYLQSTKLTPAQKQAVEKLIVDAQALLAVL